LRYFQVLWRGSLMLALPPGGRYTGRVVLSSVAFPSGRSRVNRSQSRQRREVLYRGRVQGVGFRYTTQHIATRHPVAGFVENLPDGHVRVVCEGTKEELEAFLTAVEEALGRYIEGVDSSVTEAQDEFAGFTIRR
jgi:acylphosphatase